MTRRSRSSFDLRDALSTAEALSPRPPVVDENLPDFEGVALVAFSAREDRASTAPGAASRPPPAVPVPPPPAPPTVRTSLPPLPELGPVAGLSRRLGVLVDGLLADPRVSRVVVVDADGLPIAGDRDGVEALLAATGGVAAAVHRLTLAAPGTVSPGFDMRVGDDPVLQLIGVVVDGVAVVVGISRQAAYSPADVARLRAAFSEALEGR